MTTVKSQNASTRRKPKYIVHCNQCEMLSINGIACHETGCPNSRARFDNQTGEWIKQRKCFECGCTVDADDLCCNGVDDDF